MKISEEIENNKGGFASKSSTDVNVERETVTPTGLPVLPVGACDVAVTVTETETEAQTEPPSCEAAAVDEPGSGKSNAVP